jgi:hypothetical protein
MGACNIDFAVQGKSTSSDIKAAFRQHQDDDRSYNGSRDGYSGDFQTVNDVKITNKMFDDFQTAYDYCLDTAKKWDYVVAVKYKNDEDPTGYRWLVAGWGAE